MTVAMGDPGEGNDTNNTTLHVGGVPTSLTSSELEAAFQVRFLRCNFLRLFYILKR